MPSPDRQVRAALARRGYFPRGHDAATLDANNLEYRHLADD